MTARSISHFLVACAPCFYNFSHAHGVGELRNIDAFNSVLISL